MLTILLFIFALIIPLDNKLDYLLNFGSGLNLMTYMLFLLILIWIFRRDSKAPLFIKNPINFPVLVFMLAMSFSLLTLYFQLGISPIGGEVNFFKRFLTTFIVYFIVLNISKDRKTNNTLIFGMAVMILVISMLVIKEYREHGRWHYDNDIRSYIVGMQPNHLGAFFAQYIPLLLSFVLINKNIKSKIFFLVLFLISLPALMFTYSRGAYLSIMAAFLVMGIFAKKKHLVVMVGVVFCAILLNSFLFGKGRVIPVSVRERFESITAENQDKSIEGREVAWAIAKDYIAQSPLIGYGYGASRQMLPLDTHNMYLDIALEAGVPTLLVFVWVIITILWVAVITFRKTEDPFYKALSLGLIGSTTAVVIGNIFGTRLNFFPSNGYFGILLGIVARSYSDLKYRKIKPSLQKARKYKLAASEAI